MREKKPELYGKVRRFANYRFGFQSSPEISAKLLEDFSVERNFVPLLNARLNRATVILNRRREGSRCLLRLLRVRSDPFREAVRQSHHQEVRAHALRNQVSLRHSVWSNSELGRIFV